MKDMSLCCSNSSSFASQWEWRMFQLFPAMFLWKDYFRRNCSLFWEWDHGAPSLPSLLQFGKKMREKIAIITSWFSGHSSATQLLQNCCQNTRLNALKTSNRTLLHDLNVVLQASFWFINWVFKCQRLCQNLINRIALALDLLGICWIILHFMVVSPCKMILYRNVDPAIWRICADYCGEFIEKPASICPV